MTCKGSTMPFIRKAALVCDRCSKRVDIDPEIDQPFSAINRGKGYDGWIEAREKVLCPECAEGFRKLIAENKRRENEYLGIATIEFEE